MNDAFDIYKPLRNYLRQFSLIVSLSVVRAYLQKMQFGKALPKDIQVDRSFLLAKSRPEGGVYEWELEILTKELILNCDETNSAKSLKEWRYFSGAMNKIKEIGENLAIKYREMMSCNILLEVYRIAHQQFPWQDLPSLIWITRYYKIFSHPQIDKIIYEAIGLTTKELYTIGLAMTGVYIDYFALFYPPDMEIVGIDKEKFDKFLKHFSTDIVSLKSAIKDSQLYNQDYKYSFNPLRVTPLIRITYNGQDSLICPIPTYMFRRFTEGVYYEICKNKDFAHPFGESFQKYIGEVLRKANTTGKYEVIEEKEFRVGKDRKNTVDWIVIDQTANLFVECKAKKLRLGAKIALIDNTTLHEDLDCLADFIVQVYKTTQDYRNGNYPDLKNNGKTTFPLIVTLEDWFAFGDKIVAELDSKVEQKLKENGLEPSILKNEPYTVCSSNQLEKLLQVINILDINQIMSQKVSGEYRLWPVNSFLFNKFKEQLMKTVDLFPNDFKEIHPTIANIKD